MLGVRSCALILVFSGIPALSEERVFFQEGFEDAELRCRGWYDITRTQLSPVARTGRGCIEYQWREKGGPTQGSSPMRRLFGPSEEVYVRFNLRLSPGWGWSGREYHPHLVNLLTTENTKWHGPAASHLTLYIEPVNGRLRLAAQDIQNKDQPHGLTQGPLRGGYNGKMYDSQDVLWRNDEWHLVEAYFRLNTLDLEQDRPNSDGIVRGWFDGRLVVESNNAILRSTDFPRMKFNHFLLAPYFDPGLVPQAQSLWIDDLVVASERPETQEIQK